MEDNKFPEAGAIAFFGFKRPDGFEVSLTLRDATGAKLMSRLDAAIEKVKKDGGTPLPLRGGGFPKQAKPVDYVEGRLCPKDNGRLVRTQTKAGAKFIKCENNKYDFATKRSSGCPFTEWPDQQGNGTPTRDINDY